MSFLSEPLETDRWNLEVEEVFSDKEYTPTSTIAPSIKNIFKELNDRYKERIKSWWEVRSIENYIKHKIVPRGLRISILPAQRIRTPNLMKKWEQEVTESSLRLMTLLLAEEQENLEIKNKKLKETTELALTLKSDSEFIKLETDLQKNIDRFTTALKERKHKQFVKDLTEFRENRAYLFISNKPVQRGQDSDISSTDTDISDTERRNISNRSPYRTRFGGRWMQNPNQRGQGKRRQKRTEGGNEQRAGPSSSSEPYSGSRAGSFLEQSIQEQPPQKK